MPCANCGHALDGAAFARLTTRFVTHCPGCKGVCVYVPPKRGVGNVAMTNAEMKALMKQMNVEKHEDL
jgi:hypothetical protein